MRGSPLIPHPGISLTRAAALLRALPRHVVAKSCAHFHAARQMPRARPPAASPICWRPAASPTAAARTRPSEGSMASRRHALSLAAKKLLCSGGAAAAVQRSRQRWRAAYGLFRPAFYAKFCAALAGCAENRSRIAYGAPCSGRAAREPARPPVAATSAPAVPRRPPGAGICTWRMKFLCTAWRR